MRRWAVFPGHGVVVHVDGVGVGLTFYGERAVIVFEAVVLVAGEHHAGGRRAGGRPGGEVVRVRVVGRGGSGGALSGTAEHFSESVGRESAPQHVAHVTVAEAGHWGESRRWRRGVGVVCGGGQGRVSSCGCQRRGQSRGCERGGKCCFGFRGRLSVVEVGVRRRLRGLRRALVWR